MDNKLSHEDFYELGMVFLLAALIGSPLNINFSVLMSFLAVICGTIGLVKQMVNASKRNDDNEGQGDD